MRKFLIAVSLLFAAHLHPQQPQAPTGTPLMGENVKYVQGVGPGYWPTAGSGLTVNISAGTAFCSSVVTYSGGTLTMTASATNYVYLNTSASCAPAVKTTTFTTSDIPIATVITGASSITSVTDDRTMFQQGGGGGGSGTVNLCSSGQIAYYSTSGTAVSCLTVGTGLNVTSSTLNENTNPAQISSSFAGTPANSQTLVFVPATFAITIPSSCTGSYMGAAVAATSSSAFTISKLAGGPTGTATTLCTATFAASANTATFSGSGGSLAVGDWIKIVGPSTADATLATLGVGIYGTR